VNRDVMTERLRGIVRPLADKLVDQVVAIVVKQAEASWESAISKLREQLEGTHVEEHDAGPRRSRVDRKKARRPRRAGGRAYDAVKPARAGGRDRERVAESPRAVEASPAPAAVKKPRKCGACGELGHRADRCPNAEQNPAPTEQTAPPLNTKPETSSPLPASKLDRFARIEAAARARREGLAG
jgi:hypothetical protein